MGTSPGSAASKVGDSERFRMFVTGVTDYAIYMLTPQGNVDSWNAGAQRFKGHLAEEIIGQHFSLFYTEEERAAGKPERALHIALTEGKFEDEGWRVRKDGSRFWASVVIDPIHDAEGHLIAFAKVTRDITQRKAEQEALHESEERFRLLVQGVTDYAIYMLSPTGDITNWNVGAEHIKGYSAHEVVGTHFSRFYADEDRAAGMPARALQIALAEGRYENEGWRVRKDGTRFWANVVIDPIRNAFGEHIGYAKVTRDITERRDTTMALDRAKEALFQSQKLEAIGKLTGGIAHDVNNLLAVIVTGLELISRNSSASFDSKVVASMQNAAARGAKLMQQLLMFARQQPLHQEKHNLSTLVAAFETVLRRATHESHQIEFRLATGLHFVMVDATQFEAGLLNLVSNACDAMPEGGTLRLSTANVDLGVQQVGSLPAGAYVKVVVADTGTGMTAEVVSHAVEPFFTTKELGKGTGLGLSQVYGLVQQCGGAMEIDSTPGKGTSISMYFPIVAAGEETAIPYPDLPPDTERVLVVDDQPDVLEMTVELFKCLGFDVLSATSGSEAIEVLQRTPGIGVLFSDVRMPGMSGITLGHEARKLYPKLKVVLASGFAAPALAEEDARISDFAFLKKPYLMAELAKTLRRVS